LESNKSLPIIANQLTNKAIWAIKNSALSPFDEIFFQLEFFLSSLQPNMSYSIVDQYKIEQGKFFSFNMQQLQNSYQAEFRIL
jgi:hypothetical protein